MNYDDVVKFIKNNSKYMYITRDIDILNKQVDEIKIMITAIDKIRKEYIQKKDEINANLWLSFLFITESLQDTISMFILLKNNEPNNAWVRLINAQDCAHASIIATLFDKELQHNHYKYFRDLEFLFPPQSFSSSGMIIKSSSCSICKKPMLDCDHIRGECYMGEMCSEIIDDFSIREISVVTSPLDRRCIIISTKSGNSPAINSMTLKEDKNFKIS